MFRRFFQNLRGNTVIKVVFITFIILVSVFMGVALRFTIEKLGSVGSDWMKPKLFDIKISFPSERPYINEEFDINLRLESLVDIPDKIKIDLNFPVEIIKVVKGDTKWEGYLEKGSVVILQPTIKMIKAEYIGFTALVRRFSTEGRMTVLWSKTTYVFLENENESIIIEESFNRQHAEKMREIRGKNVDTAPDKTEYVVATRINSEFFSLAEYFAEKKKAKFVTYQENINEIISDLGKYQPEYLALVLPPQDLTPDYLDYIDEKLRELDGDPFMDIAYGIITAFNVDEGYRYVDRLLAYLPLNNIEVYGVNAWGGHVNMLKEYGIEILDKCTNTMQGGSVWCDEAHKTTVSDLVEEIKEKDVFIFNLHGAPSSIQLDEGEEIKGNSGGLIGVKKNKEEVAIKLNSSLVMGMSCLTARINGSPSSLTETFPDSDLDYEGNVSTSVALSFLKSGALNYIGAPHLANMVFQAPITLVPQSILEGKPIGNALKNFKNWYIYNALLSSRDLEAAPRADDYTIKFIKAQLRNWVLFGDPSIVLPQNPKEMNDCIREYSESVSTEQVGQDKFLVKNVETKIKFKKDNKDLLTHFMKYSKISQEGETGSDVCMISIPLEGVLENFSVTHEKVNSRYDSYFAGNNNIIMNAGDELLVAVPTYIADGDPNIIEISLDFSIRMK